MGVVRRTWARPRGCQVCLSTTAGGFHTTIAAGGGIAYAQASTGVLYAVDRVGGRHQRRPSATLLTGDTLYAGGDDAGQGELQTIDARTGETPHRLGIDEHIKTNLTLADTTIYVPTINQVLSVTTS